MDFVEVMSKGLSNTKFDKKLKRNITRFRYVWENTNDININFLSSNLVGVHPIRFTDENEYDFFTEILKTDREMLQDELYNVKDIHKDRKVTSNVTYLTCIYLMHIEYKNSKPDLEYIEDLYMIMVYKMMSSLVTHYFVFPLDVNTANSVYETLNNRYLIKRLGSWRSVFLYRSRDVMCSDGLHCKRITDVTGLESGKVIADIQGRYRSILKELYSKIDEVKSNDAKRVLTSLNSKDVEGNDIVPDIDNINSAYYRYVKSVVGSKQDFVREEILILVKDLFKNINIDDLRTVLNAISKDYGNNPSNVLQLIDVSMDANIKYLHSKNTKVPYHANIMEIVLKLKRLWSSSKIKDPNLVKAKEITIEYAKLSGYTTRWRLITLGMSIGLYIFMRAVIRDRL